MGRAWVGPASEVLRKELARVGVSMDECRLTNLWLHDKVNDQAELAWHMKQLIGEMKGRRVVFLMGSDTARAFLEMSVEEVSGLEVTSPLFPRSVELAVASVNPAVVLRDDGVVGEVRLACQRFAEALGRLK